MAIPTDATTNKVAAVVRPVVKPASVQDRSGTDESDAGNNLRRNPSVIAEVLDRQHVGKNREQAPRRNR